MENENTSPASTEELEIANAFAEFAGESAAVKTSEEIAAEAAAAASATKTPEEIAAEAAAAAPAAKTPEELAAEAAAAAPAAKTPEEIAAEADAAKTATDALAAKPTAEDPRIAAMQEQIAALQPKEAPAAPVEIYTPDEKAALAKYTEDWPDIAKAEALARRAEYRELVAYVFQQVESKYAPALDYVKNRGEHDQYSDLIALVPDYDAVRDKTLAWVDTQPTWLKSAYTKVTSEGTPEEVAGLIALYKKENGIAQVAAAPVIPAAPATPAAPAIAPAAKAAAAKLTVVKTGRSEAGTATEDTFDSAFAAYAAEEDKRLSNRK